MEQQVQIRASDGSILWTGTAVIATSYVAINSDATAMLAGHGVLWDGTNGVIPRSEVTAAGATASADLPQSLSLQCKKSTTTGDVGWLGVTVEPAKAGGRVLVAGAGSIVSVITTATLLALGAKVGANTAGNPAVAAATGTTTSNVILGTVLKINQVASPGTGSTGFAGIMVGSC